MNIERCDRMWQVEALEDGRLEPKDRASFARHADTCSVCSAELERLRELTRLMASAPSAGRTELERRRLRIALLGAANQRVVERTSPSRKTLQWALVFALPLLALSALAFGRFSAFRSHSGFEVVDVARAEWSAEKSGSTSRVTLRAGVAAFHVEHVAKGARFLVSLPDGEIEVRGTRFVVDVAAGHTHSVLVTEGVVALRIAGIEQVLHPGERWQRANATALASASTAPSAPPASNSVTPALALAPAPATALATSAEPGVRRTVGVPGVAAPSAAAPSAAASVAAVSPEAGALKPTPGDVPTPASPALPGPRFAAAVAAFGAGDYGRAESLFALFARDFPSDSRAEDAAFLLADARARRGDKAGAAAAARAYLRAYPNGLRHAAAGRLAE